MRSTLNGQLVTAMKLVAICCQVTARHGPSRRLEEQGENLAVTLQVDPELGRYLMPKGYVALDGAADLGPQIDNGQFQVFLIPETREVTVTESRAVGDTINRNRYADASHRRHG